MLTLHPVVSCSCVALSWKVFPMFSHWYTKKLIWQCYWFGTAKISEIFICVKQNNLTAQQTAGSWNSTKRTVQHLCSVQMLEHLPGSLCEVYCELSLSPLRTGALFSRDRWDQLTRAHCRIKELKSTLKWRKITQSSRFILKKIHLLTAYTTCLLPRANRAAERLLST